MIIRNQGGRFPVPQNRISGLPAGKVKQLWAYIWSCSELKPYTILCLHTWKFTQWNRIHYFCLDEAIGDLRFAITLLCNCEFLVGRPSFLVRIKTSAKPQIYTFSDYRYRLLRCSSSNLCWINSWKRDEFWDFWDRGGFPLFLVVLPTDIIKICPFVFADRKSFADFLFTD